ncbi:MAG: hypothetical protein M0Z44_00110 [Gammaproteobacteria bacterium]|nr:hypothetical protein [Gammaproteobacteria bacterium]
MSNVHQTAYTKNQELAFALLRLLFGAICLINTVLEANGPYVTGFLDSILKRAKGQPAVLHQYIHAMGAVVSTLGPDNVAVAMVVINGLLALSLLTGVALRPLARLGILYNLILWSTVGGFGGPYTAGATDPGTAIVYALVFLTILSVPCDRRLTWAKPTQSTVGPHAIEPVRILFGLLWAFDAFWKWQPAFLHHSLSYLQASQAGQPEWIVNYIGIALKVFGAVGQLPFGIFAAAAETVLALSLLLKRGQDWLLPIGLLYSFGVWTTAEGWGGPYVLGSTGNRGDVLGTADIYMVVYLFLMVAYMMRQPRETR